MPILRSLDVKKPGEPRESQGKYRMNDDGVSRQFGYKWHSIPDKKWMLILAVLVFLANIQIYWVKIPVADDMDFYYRLHKSETFFTGFVFNLNYLNSFVCWVASHIDLFLARSIILVGILIPTILLLFRVLRKLAYPLPVSFFSAGIMAFMPGQINIPIFVNGSYMVDAMLFVLIAFWAGLKFLEKEDGTKWGWYAFSLLTFYYALRVSELVVPVAAAIIFCLLCWRQFDLKGWVLSGPFALLTLFNTYFNIILNGRNIAKQPRQLTFEGFSSVFQKFIAWSFPRIYVPENGIYRWAIFMAAISGICLAIGVVKGFVPEQEPPVEKRRFGSRGAYIWRIIFPVLWLIFSLIIMSLAPYFVTRHAFFPAFGLYICFSFILFEAVKKFSNTAAVALLLCLMFGSMIAHYKTVDKYYFPINTEHMEFLNFARENEYPHQAQIVLIGSKAIASTADGMWGRSTGYLRYALKRDDVSGLIGNEKKLSDPFKDETFKRGGMDGLNLFDPLFLYRKQNNGFEQVTYFLQWQGNDINGKFTIYKTDPGTGEITKLVEGNGLKFYAKEIDSLEKRGVSRADIMWGGEPSQQDIERLSISHQAGISEWQDGFHVSDGTMKKGGLGYILWTDGNKNALALKKTDTTFKNMITIKGKMKSALTSGVRNGLIVFGEDPKRLSNAAVFIGARSVAIQGPLVEKMEKKQEQFDQNKVLDTELTVNLKEGIVTWNVDGTQVKTKMKDRPAFISYIGYSVWNTKTEFSELRVSGD
jgi:hypothetical protein